MCVLRQAVVCFIGNIEDHEAELHNYGSWIALLQGVTAE